MIRMLRMRTCPHCSGLYISVKTQKRLTVEEVNQLAQGYRNGKTMVRMGGITEARHLHLRPASWRSPEG